MLDDYNNLKQTLKEVRVLGIGNSKLKACANACKILLRTMVTVAILPAIAIGSIALASTTAPIAGTALAIAGTTGASIAFAESIIPSLKLSSTRNALKTTLQNVPTKLVDDSQTTHTSYTVNGKAIVSLSNHSQDYNPKLPRPKGVDGWSSQKRNSKLEKPKLSKPLKIIESIKLNKITNNNQSVMTPKK